MDSVCVKAAEAINTAIDAAKPDYIVVLPWNVYFQARHVYGAIQIARKYHAKLPMAEAVTHRVKLADATKALEAVSKLEAVKAVVLPAA